MSHPAANFQTKNQIRAVDVFDPLPTVGIDTVPTLWRQEKAVRDSQLSESDSLKYWIVEGKQYDLSSYVHSHPGGQSWLRNTRGHDITQLFVVHHLNEHKARKVLEKYYVADCRKTIQRFTFSEDGLYRTVKRRVLQTFTTEQLQDETQSKRQSWRIFAAFVFTATVSAHFHSYMAAVVCGLLIIGLFGVMHNFMHHREGPYRHLIKLTGFSRDDFQLLHCISHHIYVNTRLDFEVTGLEPIAFWLKEEPDNKLYTQWLIQPILALASVLSILMNLIGFPLIKLQKPNLEYAYPLLVWLYMCAINGDILKSFYLWLTMYVAYNFLFFKILLCEHRMPELWTQGQNRVLDFGEHTVNTTCDVNPSVTGVSSFVLLAGFNIHAIHHFFPTVDHAMLPKINHFLIDACAQRKIPYHSMGRLECWIKFTQGMRVRGGQKHAISKR